MLSGSRACLGALGRQASPASTIYKVRVAALILHHLRIGVVSARFLRTPNARGNLQRCNGFAWDLQSALEATRVQCWLRMRSAYTVRSRHMARGFARSMTGFSEFHRFHVNNAYLAVQRIRNEFSCR